MVQKIDSETEGGTGGTSGGNGPINVIKRNRGKTALIVAAVLILAYIVSRVS